MAYEVNYATVDLHEYVTILNVNRTVTPERTNFAKDISGVHGKYYMGYKYNEKIIKLECLMKADSKEEDNDGRLCRIILLPVALLLFMALIWNYMRPLR